MAGPEFWQTVMGRRFIEGTMPRIAEELKALNKNLERLAEIEEKKLGGEGKDVLRDHGSSDTPG